MRKALAAASVPEGQHHRRDGGVEGAATQSFRCPKIKMAPGGCNVFVFEIDPYPRFRTKAASIRSSPEHLWWFREDIF
jgi:hypothetical protein